MLLWIAFALLTAAVLAWVLAPLARPAPAAGEALPPADAGSLAVYRDQLAEVETERAAGRMLPAEAEAAKLEISRRLLASAARPSEPAASGARLRMSHASLALALGIAVPLLTLGLYLANGSPDAAQGRSAAQTEAARNQAILAEMIARVEAHLREAPDDGKGWEVVAPAYLSLGRFTDAVTAYANAVRLQGESVKLLSGLGEASVLGNGGRVTDEARAAYEKVLKLEPGKVEPRFWLALAKEQDGGFAAALAEYKALLSEAPPEAPYRASLQARIDQIVARVAGPADSPAGKAAAGPGAADLEAAAKLTPAEREQMISGMVDGLAQRLKSDGKNLSGWLRLLNAYVVLGRQEEARAALVEARRNFNGDERALADLSRLAATLGLES